MADGNQTLPRRERLRGRELFDRLFNAGLRGSAGRVAVRVLANGGPDCRLAAVAGRTCGNAARRSRLRRRLRAAFRTQKHLLPKGWDVALIARPGLLDAGWEEVLADVRKAVTKAVGSRGRA